MPFVSDKQRRYLWSQKPEVAREFAAKEQAKHPNKLWIIQEKRGTVWYRISEPSDHVTATELYATNLASGKDVRIAPAKPWHKK